MGRVGRSHIEQCLEAACRAVDKQRTNSSVLSGQQKCPAASVQTFIIIHGIVEVESGRERRVMLPARLPGFGRIIDRSANGSLRNCRFWSARSEAPDARICQR